MAAKVTHHITLVLGLAFMMFGDTLPTHAQAPVRGFVDLHNHQFANLAFGGRVVTGSPYGPLLDVLHTREDRHHSPSHASDFVGAALSNHVELGFIPKYYGNDGAPTFGGWPAFYEASHQKVHQEWLHRAVQGGLRLMVMYAVESTPLCQAVNTDGRDCYDVMGPIYDQLRAAYAMQDYIDDESGGKGRGWYRIVTTPLEARRVISDGKLAVVLGVETSDLFHCNIAVCDWEQGLADLWNIGVRAFFPVHHGHNVFAAPSYFRSPLQIPFDRAAEELANHAIELALLQPAMPYPLFTEPCPYGSKSCNVYGLSPTGRQLIDRLMQFGAIIDVDHMSDRSFADTLTSAERYTYPVVASHAGFNALNRGSQNHEGQLTYDELQHINRVGGMVGLITAQGKIDEVGTYPRSRTIVHACGNSTETFLQAYYYALDNSPGMSIGIGTDLNGPLRQVGPRFGDNECDGGRNGQPRNTMMLSYPFFAGASHTSLPKQRSGSRTFDFNIDGLAHVGLLPDMFADLATLGVPASDLEPLFTSAEGFVTLWERIERRKVRIPDGFENAALARQTWSLYSTSAGFVADTTDATAHTGTRSLAQLLSAGLVYRDVAGLTPGQTYRVSAWVSADTGATATAKLTVHDGQDGGYLETPSVNGGMGWRHLSLLYTANASGTARLHLVRTSGTGTVYWDDVELIDVPENAEFERGGKAPWMMYSITSGSPFTVTDVARSGRYGLMIGPGLAYQDVSGLTPGRPYRVSAWVQLPENTTGGVELSVHNTQEGNFVQQMLPYGSGGWQELQVLYTADHTGLVRIHLVKHLGTGVAYWDDVRLSEALAISGRVTNVDGSASPGVSIRLSGYQRADMMTDTNGRYSFAGLEAGRPYTVAPTSSELWVTPCQRVYTALEKSEGAADFRFTNEPRYQITGRVLGQDGGGLSGVTLDLTGECTRSTTTTAAGAFAFPGLPGGGDYTVAPGHSLIYDFSPGARAYQALSGSQADAEFVAIPELRSIAGEVTAGRGQPPPATVITLSGSASNVTRTDGEGAFKFAGLPADGSYTLTPSSPGFAFQPASASYSVLSRHLTGVRFRATLVGYRVSGRVLRGDGSAMAGVTLTLAGPTTAIVRTDASGVFLFDKVVPGARYTIMPCTPSGEGACRGEWNEYVFNPGALEVGPVNADVSGLVLLGSNARHRITGKVLQPDGSGLAGVTLTLNGLTTSSARTNSSGSFAFEDVAPFARYTVRFGSKRGASRP